jgi:hypothetical protein
MQASAPHSLVSFLELRYQDANGHTSNTQEPCTFLKREKHPIKPQTKWEFPNTTSIVEIFRMKNKLKFFHYFKLQIYSAKIHAKYQIHIFITKEEIQSVKGKSVTVQFNNQKTVKASG